MYDKDEGKMKDEKEERVGIKKIRTCLRDNERKRGLMKHTKIKKY